MPWSTVVEGTLLPPSDVLDDDVEEDDVEDAVLDVDVRGAGDDPPLLELDEHAAPSTPTSSSAGTTTIERFMAGVSTVGTKV